MEKKFISILVGVVLLSGALVTGAAAKTVGVGLDADIEISASDQGVEGRAGAQTKGRSDQDDDTDDSVVAAGTTTVRGNATSTAARDKNDDEDSDDDGDEKGKKSTSTEPSHGETTAAEHRSAVAILVRSLLAVADREGGIGTEVRAVAQAQQDSASTSATAIDHVEARNDLLVFLIGSDYKNLGVIRSEAATTENSISRLERLRDQASSTEAKAELSAQITVLETEQVKLETFVEAHESAFSLFGWFVKLF